MSGDLRSIATDLDSFLTTVKLPPKAAAAVQAESTPVVPPKAPAQAPAKVEAVEPPPVDQAAVMARAAFDYVTSRLDESDGARTIGEAYMLAVAALSQDANIPLERLHEAAISFLEEIVDVARESL